MKNLKKVLALVVALTMVLGTVAFAAFTDVAVEDDEYTAVSTLSSLEILNGYEDGSFKPDGDITRAEFCAVVCRALGYEPAAGATMFTDVPADHWAAGYINTCAGAKIVNGMGDGTFAPNANVTYEQAVKMLVVALGYEPMAAQKGGYPTGYMVVANTYGMTKGVSVASQAAAASRGIVAQLTYNALDIPMMDQTGFGTNTEFQILDGTNGKDYKTLLTGLDVAKLEGIVEGTPIIEFDGETCAADEVVYCIKEANDNEYFEDKLEDEDCYDATLKVAEGVNAADYFGVASIVYAKEVKKNTYEIIAIMPGEDSEIVELGLEDLDEETTDSKVEYYPSASSSDTDSYKLDAEAKFYYNYATVDSLTEVIFNEEGDLRTGADVEITLIENSGDNKFDIVVMKEYAYDLVKTVEDDEFESNDGATFKFDFEDEDVNISIVNKDGEEIGLEDFAENDVIAYITDGNTKNYDWIEIINLGQNAVTGTIDEKTTDAIYVDGTKYDYIVDGLKLGDEGTFFLTRTGKIFAYDKDASVAGNYAIILDCGADATSFSDGYQVKLLTKNNEIIIYNLRDNLVEDDELIADLDALATDAGDDVKADADERLITFKLDSKNYIREINFVEATAIADDSEYDADGESLGNETVSLDAVIFNVTPSSIDSVYAAGVSYLVNEGKYSGYVAYNEDDEADCIIITEGGSLIDYTQDLAVVAEVTTITINDGADDAQKIRYYVSGDDELKEIIVVKDQDVTAMDNSDYDDIDVGDVFMFADNGEGVATAFEIVANLENDEYVLNTDFTDLVEDDENANTKFVIGYIENWKTVNAGVQAITSEGNLTIKGSTNDYTVEERSKNTVIHVGDWREGDVDKLEDGEANYFVARKVKNNVNDIVVVSNRAAVVEDEPADDVVDSAADSSADSSVEA
ncbi:MAG: S-layer homology domain-containing protein [Clostridia bacterium]|nr:S-layer homology domain-containing protein [Clostridia bacterium]